MAILHVTGMHCKSCVFLVKDTLEEYEGINGATVDLHRQTVEIMPTNTDQDIAELITQLNPFLQAHGYQLHTDKPVSKIDRREYVFAFVITIIILYGFNKLQDLGLLDLIHAEKRTYTTSIFIGMIASVSSCLAVVGGIVLSLGTMIAKETKSTFPQRMFHAGRLGGFFILGGILGLLGSAFQISPNITIVLNIVVGIVMSILGLNLLGIIRGGATLDGGIFRRFGSKGGLTRGPLLLGVGTFFAPCGFTQSMQIYALSTGSFVTGALTMLSFALGTFPVLLFLSLTGKTIQQSNSSSLFFKVIGFVLVLLSIYNIYSSLIVLGTISPLI